MEPNAPPADVVRRLRDGGGPLTGEEVYDLIDLFPRLAAEETEKHFRIWNLAIGEYWHQFAMELQEAVLPGTRRDVSTVSAVGPRYQVTIYCEETGLVLPSGMLVVGGGHATSEVRAHAIAIVRAMFRGW